jgi:predicted dehydrogenase
MADAAEAKGVINMVNLTHRASPALEKARQILLSGAIGELRHFEASYMQSWLVGKYWGDWRDPKDRWLWRLSSAHGSKGVVGDIGIHIIDFATYGAASDIASASPLVRTFHKAKDDRIGEYVLDANDSFVMTAELANGAVGVIQATRWATGFANDLFLNLYGTKGSLKVFTQGQNVSLSMCAGANVDDQRWEDVPCPPVTTIFARFAEAVRSGKEGDPNFRRGADLQRVLDRVLEAGAGTATSIRIG